MTKEELQAIKDRLSKIKGLPWINTDSLQILSHAPQDIAKLIEEVESLKVRGDDYKIAAESWMDMYDKLKEKYEPSILEESDHDQND